MRKIIGIILVFSLCLVLAGCGKKTNIVLEDNLDFQINSEVKLLSLVKNIENGKIISEDETIDTKSLGTKEVSFKYTDEKNKEKIYTFEINIVDKEKPIIAYNKNLTTTMGVKIDLLKGVKVTNKSYEKVDVSVVGDYNFNKAGTYKLRYVAVDSSGNVGEAEFTLTVKDLSLKLDGCYKWENSDQIAYFTFRAGSKVELRSGWKNSEYDLYYGTYKIEGTQLIATFTVYKDPYDPAVKLKEPFDLKYTIISVDKFENTVEGRTVTYTYSRVLPF